MRAIPNFERNQDSGFCSDLHNLSSTFPAALVPFLTKRMLRE